MRKEQAQQTRRRLFDSAYQLLKEKAFESISIKEIASRAGVSTGTFYLYFPSKLDVYYQTYIMAEEYFSRIVSRQVQTGSAKERLLIFFHEYACYNSDYTSIKLTKLLYNGNNRYFLRESSGEGMFPLLKDILRYGIQQGELDATMDIEDMSQFLMNAVRGLTYHWCISDGSYDIKEATRRYVLRLYRSIERRY